MILSHLNADAGKKKKLKMVRTSSQIVNVGPVDQGVPGPSGAVGGPTPDIYRPRWPRATCGEKTPGWPGQKKYAPFSGPPRPILAVQDPYGAKEGPSGPRPITPEAPAGDATLLRQLASRFWDPLDLLGPSGTRLRGPEEPLAASWDLGTGPNEALCNKQGCLTTLRPQKGPGPQKGPFGVRSFSVLEFRDLFMQKSHRERWAGGPSTTVHEAQNPHRDP